MPTIKIKQPDGSWKYVNEPSSNADTLDGKHADEFALVSDSINVTATVGQTIVVEEVDVNGKPTKWKATDYQERTHWEDEDGTVHKIDNKYINSEWMATKEVSGDDTLHIPEQKISGSLWNNLKVSLQLNSTYDVYINGVKYVCVAKEEDGFIILGNNSSMTLNDYPFCVSWAGGSAPSGMFFNNGTISSPIMLKVTGHIETVYNKLPAGYLPDDLAPLTEITEADNGKVLMVVNGKLQLVNLNLTVDDNGVVSV